MDSYKIDIFYNNESHYINDFSMIEKNIAENILNGDDKVKFIIKNIKLLNNNCIIIKKDDNIIFEEEINLENNSSNNVKISYELIKDTNEFICKYIWIYLIKA